MKVGKELKWALSIQFGGGYHYFLAHFATRAEAIERAKGYLDRKWPKHTVHPRALIYRLNEEITKDDL